MYWVIMITFGVILGFVFGSICSSIADRKGYDETMFFFVGFIFGITGIIVALLLSNKKVG